MPATRGFAVNHDKTPAESFLGKLSARGQVVIPQALREWAELREGTQLIFSAGPDRSILIRRGAPDTTRFEKLRGAWNDSASAVRERLEAVRQPTLEVLPPEPEE